MTTRCMQRLANINRRHRQHHDNSPSKKSSSPVHNSMNSFSSTLMEKDISMVESIITKWYLKSSDPNVPTFVQDCNEIQTFLRCIDELHRTMIFFTSPECLESNESRSHFLIRAQGLMEMATVRLGREFQKMLSSTRYGLDSARSSKSDPDSEDEMRTIVDQASDRAMADLQSIAKTMISVGYGKECISIYKIIRKSIVKEALHNLGFEFLTPNKIQKLEWSVLELKIRNWLAASAVAVRTLFTGEQILCDRIFDGSAPIRESCFSNVAKEAAINFFGFAEAVSKTKRSPEKLFLILDMYNSMSDLGIDIESVFSLASTSAVRSQAMASMLKLAEAARSTISELESVIQRDESKNRFPGSGVHPLTRYTMNYLALLADYEDALANIYADFPFQRDESSAILTSPPSSQSEISLRFAWLILVIQCKLDRKADFYKEPALSYLFLANNLQYMVNKVKESKLGFILGKDWIAKHLAKTRRYLASYEKHGWARVAAAIPSPELAAEPPVADERVRVFNASFEDAVRVQKEWVVADRRMREEVRSSAAELIVPAYRAFYDAYRPLVSADVATCTALRFAPEDIVARVMELFSGSDGGGSSGCGGGSGGDGSRSGSGSGSCSSISSWWFKSQ